MAEQRGRCVNVEFCPVATTRRIAVVPDGGAYVCARCGEPLEPAGRIQVVAGKRLATGLQIAVVVLFGAALAYKFAVPAALPQRGNAVAAGDARDAAVAPAGTTAAGTELAPVVVAAADVTPAVAGTVGGGMVHVETGGVETSGPLAPDTPAMQRVAAASPAPISAPAASLPPPAPTVPSAPEVLARPAVGLQSSRADVVASTVLLRIAGPDVVAAKLASRLASGYLAVIGDAGIGVEAGGADGVQDVFGMQAGQREVIRIVSGGDADPPGGPGPGGADVSISFRKPPGGETGPPPAESAVAARTVVAAGGGVAMAVLGLGVVVSRSNPATALTTDQLRGVLAGRIANWSELRGRDAPINLHLPGAQASFGGIVQDMQLLPGGTAVRSAQRYATEAEVAGAVADDADGLGFVMAGNAGQARLLAIGKDGAPPVLPSNMALATEEYPLTRRLYLQSARDGGNAVARRFVDYVLSPIGQAAIEAAGFATLPLRSERGPGAEAGPDRLRQLITGSTRVSADLHFYPGSVQLDARSVRELERLVAFLRSERVSADRVILAGFTDNYGPPAANLAVSKRRAEMVTAALARYGIVPGETIGFGAELPIGDNATPDGRERNRRVEVYLAP